MAQNLHIEKVMDQKKDFNGKLVEEIIDRVNLFIEELINDGVDPMILAFAMSAASIKGVEAHTADLAKALHPMIWAIQHRLDDSVLEDDEEADLNTLLVEKENSIIQ